jgi:membrane protein implicated in regulation of membrane protease activity
LGCNKESAELQFTKFFKRVAFGGNYSILSIVFACRRIVFKPRPYAMNVAPELWIIVGFACILLELVIPGLMIVFFGTSAVVVGLLLKWGGLPSGYGAPLVVLLLLSVGQILFLRKYLKEWFRGKSLEGEDDQQSEYVGKQATVVSGFETQGRSGKVSFRGTEWTAFADCPLEVGDEVEIVEQQGIRLKVERRVQTPRA